MKYLKTFENRFTNVFKSHDLDMWNSAVENDLIRMGIRMGYNALMQSAYDGNLKRFIYLLPDYIDKLNDILKYQTVLFFVITGEGDIYEKKKMIQLLLDNGIDYNIKYKGETFYDLITDDKLKKWLDKKYPEIVKELKLNKNTDKFNI